MEKTILFFLSFLLFGTLCACSTVTPTEDRVAICRELRSKMIFNGNTSNNRKSEIQNSEEAILLRQYNRYHCDEIF